jgi:hypothetical protein
MKRVGLITLLTIVAGSVSAAMFVPPFAPSPSPEPTNRDKLEMPVRPSAPTITETQRPPVPLLLSPRPATPAVASLPEPVLAAHQLRTRAAASIAARNTRQEGDQGADSQCKGRPLHSVMVAPDGTVHLRC